MKVKAKIIAISGVSVFILVVLVACLFNIVIIKYTDSVEVKKLDNSYTVLNSIVGKEREGLERISRDWANWDDTYNFIEGINRQSYIDENLQQDSLKQLGLSFMVLLDDQGNLLYNLTRDMDDSEKELIAKKISSDKSSYKNKSGVINIQGKVIVIAGSGVTTTDGMAESNGTIIVGRLIDNLFISYIESAIKADIKLGDPGSLNDSDYGKIEKTPSSATEYKKISDITEKEPIEVSLTVNRDEYNAAVYNLKNFIIIFAAAAAAITLLAMAIANKFLMKRLGKVNQFVNSVKETKDTKAVLAINGSDEISELADSINEMLKSLNTAHEDTKTAEERYKLILESTNDGYIDYNFDTNEFYFSSEYARFFGCEKTQGIYNPSENRLNNLQPESMEKMQDKFNSFVWQKGDSFEDEYEITKISGEKVWIYQIGKIVSRDENGRPLRLISILKDRTAQKQHEEELMLLSYSDKLTGLKNRAYMENKFYELDQKPDSSYSVIIGDLNGLKITNDTFGHQEGDRVIKRAADVMKAVCLNNEIVARWGGDEFVILVENRDYDYTLELIKKVKEECENIVGFNYKVSIALGSARRINKINSETVMNMAEEKMYRSKLIEKSSSRNATIVSLEKTLYEKNSETEEHTRRIKILSKKLGERLGLSMDKLDELELLSALHDIGKIGIPEQILTKPGKLTNDEWNVMKKHTEIGYRIARATPELSHVAFEILCHHEKYDGTGYPQGIKGENIPVLSRIINVVDSFDVMTHKRSYKGAYDNEYAVNELKRCAGTQFDPEIVEEFLKILKHIPWSC